MRLALAWTITATIWLFAIILLVTSWGQWETEDPQGYLLLDADGNVVIRSDCPPQWYARMPEALWSHGEFKGRPYADIWTMYNGMASVRTIDAKPLPECGPAYVPEP